MDVNVKQRLAQDRTVLVSLGDHRKPYLEMLKASGREVHQVACKNENKEIHSFQRLNLSIKTEIPFLFITKRNIYCYFWEVLDHKLNMSSVYPVHFRKRKHF